MTDIQGHVVWLLRKVVCQALKVLSDWGWAVDLFLPLCRGRHWAMVGLTFMGVRASLSTSARPRARGTAMAWHNGSADPLDEYQRTDAMTAIAQLLCVIDWMRSGRAVESIPCCAAGVDGGVVAVVDAIAEEALPEELPDVLHRVEFRRVVTAVSSGVIADRSGGHCAAGLLVSTLRCRGRNHPRHRLPRVRIRRPESRCRTGPSSCRPTSRAASP